MAKFSDRLEEALRMREMTPAELARKTGIGEGAISQYRKGAYKATQSNLEKIANALNVSIPWLMGAVDTHSMQSSVTTPHKNVIKVAGRDGSFIEKYLDDRELQMLKAYIDLLPDASEDL